MFDDRDLYNHTRSNAVLLGKPSMQFFAHLE